MDTETLYSDPGEDTQVTAPAQPQQTAQPAAPQTQAQPQTPPQAQQAQPAKPNGPYQPHNVFGKIFEILGGGPQIKYSVDPDSGKVTETDVTTKGDLAKHIVAGALTGLFSGAQYHGPGAGLHALGMGGEAAANMAGKQNAEARQKAIEDAKNQQEAQLRKAEIFARNAEAVHNVRNAEKMQGDILDDVVARDGAQLAEIPEDGIIAKNVPQSEAMAKLKSGEYNGGKMLFLADGKTVQKDANGQDVLDPKTGERKFEPTVSIVNNVPVPLSKEDAARYAAARVPGFTNGAAPAGGTQIPLVTKRAWENQVHSVAIARGIAKDVGSEEEFTKALDTPGAAAALKDFSRFAGLHDPYAAIKQMETAKNKDGSPVYSSRSMGILADMFGGKKAQDYHDKLSAQTKAAEIKSDADAKSQTTQGKLEIAQKRAELGKTQAETEKIRNEMAAAPYYAVDPKTGQTVQTTGDEIKAKKYTNPVKVTEGQISKDRDANATMGDVQINISRYDQALKRLPIDANRTAIAAAINEGGMTLGAHNSALGVQIPTDWFNKITNSAVWGELSGPEQDAVIAYYRAKGAIPAFVKAVTGSGRANKETMDIEMANMPDPTLPKQAAQKQLDAFQENVGQRSKSIPKLAGVESQREIKQRIDDENAEALKSAPKFGSAESGVKIVQGHAIPADARQVWPRLFGAAGIKGYQDADGSWVDFHDPRYRNDSRFHQK
jgi:hypothetical protein